jgi:ferredoxin
MKKIIYFFSGTGNSYQIARDLSQLLGDTTIKKITETAKIDLSADTIGVVFPVYLWGMPEIISQFIRRMNKNAGKYFFSVATYKSQAGNVIGQVEQEMRKSGNKLSAGFTVPMPGNNIIWYDVESPQIQENKFKAFKDKLAEIAQFIELKQEVFPAVSFTDRLETTLLHKVLIGTFKKSDKQFWVEPSCNGCGICSKVCTVNNIKMIDSHPVWQHNCQLCVACINLCPSKAIQYGKTTKMNQRYINPTVQISELINNSH